MSQRMTAGKQNVGSPEASECRAGENKQPLLTEQIYRRSPLQGCSLQTGHGQRRGGRICLWLPRDSGSTRSEPRAFSDLAFLHLEFIERDLKPEQDRKTRASTHIPGTHDTIHRLVLLIHSKHAETLWRGTLWLGPWDSPGSPLGVPIPTLASYLDGFPSPAPLC